LLNESVKVGDAILHAAPDFDKRQRMTVVACPRRQGLWFDAKICRSLSAVVQIAGLHVASLIELLTVISGGYICPRYFLFRLLENFGW